jgi:hypothetical protein
MRTVLKTCNILDANNSQYQNSGAGGRGNATKEVGEAGQYSPLSIGKH